MSRRRDAVDDTLTAGLRALPAWRGKAKVALAWKRLRERHGALTGGWHGTLADGSHVDLPRGSAMTWSVAATGGWDRPVIDFVRRFVTPDTLVLDVGASLGLWSVPLGRTVRDRGGQLWCFEPNPQNIAWLESNIAANELSGVARVQPYAIGARRGNALLGFREQGGGNGAITSTAEDAVAVEVRRIDDFELPLRVSFVKLDVEGFELEVLRGAQSMIERDRPVIFGEFSCGWLHERGEDLAAELHALSACGYDVFAIEDRRSAPWRTRDVTSLRRLDPWASAGMENLLLVPRAISA